MVSLVGELVILFKHGYLQITIVGLWMFINLHLICIYHSAHTCQLQTKLTLLSI